MKRKMQDWAREICETAKAHGWHDGPERSASAYACLIASELSEALEEAREGRPMVYGEDFEECERIEGMDKIRALGLKPEGIAVELIDCVIRILDYAWATWGEGGPHNDPEEWSDFAAATIWPDGTPMRDVPLEDLLARAHWHIAKAWEHKTGSGALRPYSLMDCASLIIGWLEAKGVDAEAVMQLKCEYNRHRPYRHGGKLL